MAGSFIDTLRASFRQPTEAEKELETRGKLASFKESARMMTQELDQSLLLIEQKKRQLTDAHKRGQTLLCRRLLVDIKSMEVDASHLNEKIINVNSMIRQADNMEYNLRIGKVVNDVNDHMRTRLQQIQTPEVEESILTVQESETSNNELSTTLMTPFSSHALEFNSLEDDLESEIMSVLSTTSSSSGGGAEERIQSALPPVPSSSISDDRQKRKSGKNRRMKLSPTDLL